MTHPRPPAAVKTGKCPEAARQQVCSSRSSFSALQPQANEQDNMRCHDQRHEERWQKTQGQAQESLHGNWVGNGQPSRSRNDKKDIEQPKYIPREIGLSSPGCL